MNSDHARQTVQSLVDLAIEKMPRRYDGKRHWEDTKKVWAGIKVRREGLELKTHRRWRELRHGLQTKYHVAFPGPETSPPPIDIEVLSVQCRPPQDGQPAGWVIECEAETPLDFAARIQRWNLGVQWYSIEITGHMTVRLRLTSELSAFPDFSEVPPAMVIAPEITAANVHLDEFHVDRISKVGGEVAEQWGDMAKRIADEILLDELNESLPRKINRSIEKHRDDLRLSAADWLRQMSCPTE